MAISAARCYLALLTVIASYAATPAPVRDNGLVATFYAPDSPGKHPGLIVIGGSDGGIGQAGAWGEFLAPHGYAVLALAYFHMENLPAQIEEIPLEYFKKAIDWMRAQPSVDSRRIGFMGNSKGAEAALLVASTYSEIAAVVAGSPSSVVWQGPTYYKPGTARSSWSLAGKPVPFVPQDSARPFTSLLDTYTDALRNSPAVPAAAIAVEKIQGPVLLFTGSADNVWPSGEMADLIAARLQKSGSRFPCERRSYENAGHMILVPPRVVGVPGGASTLPPAAVPQWILQMGGTREADAAGIADAWTRVVSFLDRNLMNRPPA